MELRGPCEAFAVQLCAPVSPALVDRLPGCRIVVRFAGRRGPLPRREPRPSVWWTSTSTWYAATPCWTTAPSRRRCIPSSDRSAAWATSRGARCAAGRLPGEGLPVGLRRAAGAAGERRGGLPAGHRDHCRSRPGGRRQALFAGGVARGSAGPGGGQGARLRPGPARAGAGQPHPRPPGAADGARGPAARHHGRRPAGGRQESLARQHRPEQRLQRRHPSLALGGFAGLRQPLATRPRHLADLFHRAAGPGQRQGLVRLLYRAAEPALERAAVRLPVRQRRGPRWAA